MCSANGSNTIQKKWGPGVQSQVFIVRQHDYVVVCQLLEAPASALTERNVNCCIVDSRKFFCNLAEYKNVYTDNIDTKMSNWEKYHNANRYQLPDTSERAYAEAIALPDVSRRLNSQEQLRVLTLGVASEMSTFSHMKMWHNRFRPGSLNYDQHVVVDMAEKPLVDSKYELGLPNSVHFLQVDSRELPFQDGYFDVVMTHCLFGCMDWVSVQQTLAETARVTHSESVQLHNVRGIRSGLMVLTARNILGGIFDYVRFGVAHTRRHEKTYEHAFMQSGQQIIGKEYDSMFVNMSDTVTYALAHPDY